MAGAPQKGMHSAWESKRMSETRISLALTSETVNYFRDAFKKKTLKYHNTKLTSELETECQILYSSYTLHIAIIAGDRRQLQINLH